MFETLSSSRLVGVPEQAREKHPRTTGQVAVEHARDLPADVVMSTSLSSLKLSAVKHFPERSTLRSTQDGREVRDEAESVAGAAHVDKTRPESPSLESGVFAAGRRVSE